MLPSQAGRSAAGAAATTAPPEDGVAATGVAATNSVIESAMRTRSAEPGRRGWPVMDSSCNGARNLAHATGLRKASGALRQLPEPLGQPQVLGVVDRDFHE